MQESSRSGTAYNHSMAAGLYVSIPFCRSKCSYCNFASGVFSKDRMQKFVDRVSADIADSESLAKKLSAEFIREVDSIYLGGGTPTILAAEQLRVIFAALRARFDVSKDAEVTVECAPGTLSPELIASLRECGVSRLSLGVQSFIDAEAKSVARLHGAEDVRRDVAALREAGITNLNLDLIAGLPHQTMTSWQQSLDQLIELGTRHASIYMLEVDEDSRLGRELIAGGTRYHAHHVPDDALTADMYSAACERLHQAGIEQYEISNFAAPGSESKHNLKYWRREPYFGFGLDAHSMLPAAGVGGEAVRFSTQDDLDSFLAKTKVESSRVGDAEAWEERFFLGLRLNRGIDLDEMNKDFGEIPPHLLQAVEAGAENGLLVCDGGQVRLTDRGRMLSNEVFAGFLQTPQVVHVS